MTSEVLTLVFQGPFLPPPQRMAPVGVAATSPVTAAPVTVGPQQLAKLRSELDVVDQNRKVLSDMLTELTPGQEKPDDHALLKVCDVCPRAGGYFILRSCCQSDRICHFF